MALEASIVQRLEELRRWQIEQQERLIQHQKEQRETLSREQIRMYQALGLTAQDINDNDDKGDNFQDSLVGNTELTPLTNRYQDVLTKNLEDSQVSTPSQRSRSISNEQNVTDLDSISKHQSLLPSQQKVITDSRQSAETGTDDEVSSVVGHGYSSNSELLNALAIDSEHEFLNSNIVGTPIKLMTLDDDFIDDKKDKYRMNASPSSECMAERVVKPSKTYADSIMDGVRPLPLEKLKNKTLFIDDIPVPSPKKDFHSLLEERLKESTAAYETDKSTSTVKNVTKRPFLKKGQGLARFRSRSNSERSSKSIRPRAMSLPSTVRVETSKNTKPNSEKSINRSRSMKNITGNTDKTQKKLPQIPNRAQNRLNLKNVPPPTKRRSESRSMPLARSVALVNEARQNDRLNNSDLEAKTKRELEEVRIFELLEEKAENSSFCSTSSTVVALLQQSVQSTPLKSRNICMNNKPALPPNKSTETNDSTEDLLLSEIVDTTKSNATIHNSCISYKPQFQNDAVNQQREDTAAQGSQVVDAIVDEPSFDDNCMELPYGTDIDSNYGNDFAEVDDITSQRNKDIIEPKMSQEKNTSLHVRFSEYNEYKTFGLTDTSTMSMESIESQKYSDQRAWSDCSIATDSSDTEEYASLTQNDQAKIMKLQAALQHEYHRNSGTYTNRNYNDESCDSLSENGNPHKRNQRMECIDQIETPRSTVMDVNSATDEKNQNYRDGNETSILSDTTLIEEATNTKERNEEGLIFKSELLKTRLLELEREIEIFRKENLAVSTQREKLIEERKTFERQFKMKESQFEEYKKTVENALQEERKKLTRDKLALENRLKDAQAKAQQSKQERQEIQILKDELDELKEEISQKESRWNAAQARQRSQTRILQTENTKLKQEIQKLQSTRSNGRKIRANAKNTVSANTKAIHQINKQLDSQRLDKNKQNSTSEDDGDDCPIEPMMEALSMKVPTDHQESTKTYPDGSKMIIYDHQQTESKDRNFIIRTKNLYENLLKEATSGLTPLSQTNNNRHIKNSEQSASAPEYLQKYDDSENAKYDQADMKTPTNNRNKSNSDPRHGLDNSHGACNGVVNTEIFKDVGKTLENCTAQGRSGKYIVSSESESENGGSSYYQNRKPAHLRDSVIEDHQGIKEVRYPDGRVEFLYPNGNVKKISADGMVTKLIYYNGDVCESRKNGSIRYFYAAAKTWHTTMLDGLEILEFPNGQVERRSTDGTLEVSFPDGSVRILQSDGTEKWALPDGTVAETSTSGEKILILPNGQREVHTADHKRREYPDGTVKLVYPDGSQETRYASGRIRLKDKDGNLLMDTHQE